MSQQPSRPVAHITSLQWNTCEGLITDIGIATANLFQAHYQDFVEIVREVNDCDRKKAVNAADLAVVRSFKEKACSKKRVLQDQKWRLKHRIRDIKRAYDEETNVSELQKWNDTLKYVTDGMKPLTTHLKYFAEVERMLRTATTAKTYLDQLDEATLVEFIEGKFAVVMIDIHEMVIDAFTRHGFLQDGSVDYKIMTATMKCFSFASIIQMFDENMANMHQNHGQYQAQYQEQAQEPDQVQEPEQTQEQLQDQDDVQIMDVDDDDDIMIIDN